MVRSSLWLSSLTALGVALTSNAHAQSNAPAAPAADQPGALQEVIVTSQKRAENVQDVPLSIVAVSGAQLANAGITNVEQLQQIVPSFQLYTIAQSSGVTLLVRGFGSNSNAAIDPDVAPYVDGVYIPRPGAILTSFLDIATIEVLRGPQGTLSGRNATVGAIAFTTNPPSFRATSGEASLDVSSYGTYKGTVIGNLPVTDTFAVRAAIEATTTDGFNHNAFDGKTLGQATTTEGKLSAKWAITPTLTWVGRVDLAKTTGDGYNFNAIDVNTAPAAQLSAFEAKVAAAGGTESLLGKTSYDPDQRFDHPGLNDQQSGLSSDLTWDAGGGYKLRLIDSYRDWKDHQTDGDNSGTTLDI